MRRDLILRTKLIWQIELIPLRQLKGNRTFFFTFSFFPNPYKKCLLTSKDKIFQTSSCNSEEVGLSFYWGMRCKVDLLLNLAREYEMANCRAINLHSRYNYKHKFSSSLIHSLRLEILAQGSSSVKYLSADV